MIKKTVTYEDFNGNQVTEDLYFHMSKVELVNLELSTDGGLSTVIPEMLKQNNMGEVVRLFNKMISNAYGERSEDGKRFVKDPQKTQDFMTSPAFDALFTDLISGPEAAAEFIQGIVPKDLLAQVEAQAAQAPATDEVPLWVRENRDPTNAEIATMSTDQIRDAMRAKVHGGSTAVPSQPKQVL